MNTQPEVAEILRDLIDELGTEIDLHYEDEGLPAAIPAMMKLERAATWLEAHGETVPAVYKHLLTRFAKITH